MAMGSVMWLSSYFLFPVLDAACRVLARGGGESNTDPGFPYGCRTAPPSSHSPARCPGSLSAGSLWRDGLLGRTHRCWRFLESWAMFFQQSPGGWGPWSSSLSVAVSEAAHPVASLWGLIRRPVGIYRICPHVAWEVGAPGGIGVVVLSPTPLPGLFLRARLYVVPSLFCEHKACRPADF